MKLFKSVVVFFVLLIVNVLATPLTSRLFPVQEITVISLEEPCVRQGGLCMRKEECEPKYTVGLSNLCPMQSHLGVVCCYD